MNQRRTLRGHGQRTARRKNERIDNNSLQKRLNKCNFGIDLYWRKTNAPKHVSMVPFKGVSCPAHVYCRAFAFYHSKILVGAKLKHSFLMDENKCKKKSRGMPSQKHFAPISLHSLLRGTYQFESQEVLRYITVAHLSLRFNPSICRPCT